MYIFIFIFVFIDKYIYIYMSYVEHSLMIEYFFYEYYIYTMGPVVDW